MVRGRRGRRICRAEVDGVDGVLATIASVMCSDKFGYTNVTLASSFTSY